MDAHITLSYRSQDAARLLVGLICLEVLFAAAYVFIFVWPGVHVPEIVRLLLDLDREASLPTWFATVQLFSIGAIFFLTAWRTGGKKHLPSALLLLGGLFFTFLSADEGGIIHERITLVMRGRNLDFLLFPGSYGGWIPVYGVAGLVLASIFGFYFRQSLRKIWQRFPRKILMMIGGFITIVAGAVGAEIVFYLFLETETAPYYLEVATEEFLEMAGASIILYSTLEMAAVLCSEESIQGSPIQS